MSGTNGIVSASSSAASGRQAGRRCDRCRRRARSSPGSSTAVTTETTRASFDASSATTRSARSSPSRATSKTAFAACTAQPGLAGRRHHRVARRHDLHRSRPVRRHTGRDPVVGQIRDLPCRAVRAAKEPAIDQDSHADAGADGQARHHIDALGPRLSACSPTAHRLASFSTITVEPFDSEQSTPARATGRAVPSRADSAPDAPCRVAMSGMPGVPRTVTTMSSRGQPGLGDGTVDAIPDGVRTNMAPDRLRFGCSTRATTRPVQVRDRDVDHPPADVDADDVARVRSGAVDDRGPAGTIRPAGRSHAPGHAAPDPEALGPTVGLERPASPAISRTRRLTMLSQPVQHQPLVERAHARRRSRLRRSVGPPPPPPFPSAPEFYKRLFHTAPFYVKKLS